MTTPKFTLKDDKMANRFKGSKSAKTVKFLEKDIEICKLTINQVLRIQAATKEAEGQDNSTILILSAVIKEGASELRDLTQEDLQDFPMDDLAALSNEIMEFSGLNPKAA